MAKSLLRLKARNLRRNGMSLKAIAKAINVSPSSVSNWIRDIPLTEEQKIRLNKAALDGAALGRSRAAELMRIRHDKLIKQLINQGQAKITLPLSKREILLIGLALYWGEGSKRNRQLQFCNSDPAMIQFLLLWLQKCFDIKREEIVCWVGINETHRGRDEVVRAYWSHITGLTIDQFRKTSLKRVRNQKSYDNFEDHYGTLFIKVKAGMIHFHQIMGMIEVLKNLPR